MAKQLYVVVASRLAKTGVASYRFLIDSGAPDLFHRGNHFALFTLEAKPSDYVDPFRLARGEAGAIGPDGSLRWNLNVFAYRHGFILGSGADEDGQGEKDLQKILRDNVPDYCVILTHAEALPKLHRACKEAGIEIAVHNYNGVLSTS